jgi:hypothetical protein
MNRQYIDFVPAKSKKIPDTPKMVTIQTTTTETVSVVEREVPKPKTTNLGMVEDLNQKFVKTNVQKRPLGQKPLIAGDALSVLKAQKIKASKIPKPIVRPAEPVVKPVEKPMELEKKHTYQAPKVQFINQEKIAKRPLSKNVYLRELEKSPEKESEAQKPLVIASEPKKKSHWGTVIAIIVTIIVGIAAGGVAFLLLPK